jgi:hypothetical protein
MRWHGWHMHSSSSSPSGTIQSQNLGTYSQMFGLPGHLDRFGSQHSTYGCNILLGLHFLLRRSEVFRHQRKSHLSDVLERMCPETPSRHNRSKTVTGVSIAVTFACFCKCVPMQSTSHTLLYMFRHVKIFGMICWRITTVLWTLCYWDWAKRRVEWGVDTVTALPHYRLVYGVLCCSI